MYDYGYGNGNSLWGFIFMLLIMALVVVGIVAIVRHFGRDVSTGQHGETALELLKKRYAKGEIDKKEYAEMRKDLNG